MFHRKRTEEVNNKTVNGRRNSDNYVRKDGQDDKRVSTRRYNLGGGYLPDGTIDKIVATKYKRGTNLHTKTSRLKISNTRLKKFASGELLPPMGSGRGRGGYIDDNWYRSSYEIIMARYLILAGIKFDYEKDRVSYNGGTKLSDFKVDNEIYEVYGWQDKSDVVKAFEDAGYIIHLIGPDEIDLMGMFND